MVAASVRMVSATRDWSIGLNCQCVDQLQQPTALVEILHCDKLERNVDERIKTL